MVNTIVADKKFEPFKVEFRIQNFLGLIAGVLQPERVDRLAGGERSSLPEVSLERQAIAAQEEIVVGVRIGVQKLPVFSFSLRGKSLNKV